MTTLIHLVSEQTMQNLLPLLALRPQRVIQICSDDDKFRLIAANFENAARKADGATEFQIYQLRSPSPTTEDVRQAHKQLISVFPGAVANITGGTKLMSLGAYLGASEFHDSPILYCDTQNKRFIQVGKVPLPGSLAPFDNVAGMLTVPMVMAAQGKDFKESPITPALLEFGCRAWKLRQEHHEPIATWTKAIRDAQPRRNHRIERSRAALEAYLAKPLPAAQSSAAEEYLDAAAEAGILRVAPNGGAYLNARPNKSEVEQASNLLDGGWLELAVAAMAGEGNRYGDVHWSVQPPDQTGADYGETDLIAVDRDKLNLAVISCKTSTQHISTLEHLSSWRDRARTLGGSHASGHLCLFRAKSPEEETRLHAMGGKMNLNVHIGEEIHAHFVSSGV